MIRLGLRLTLNGGREALVRLGVTAIAVAIGVGLLLVTLAGMNGLASQNARAEWLNTVPIGSSGPGLPAQGLHRGSAGGASTSASSSVDPLWWLYSTDEFDGQTIDRVDVAVTGPSSPVLPGIAHVPGPGQFYASPALSALLRSTPASELGDRFPGNAGRHDRPGRASISELIDHRRRLQRQSAVRRSGRL